MSDWKKYRLGDIASRITSGGTPSTREKEYYNGNIPWLRTQEVNFNRIYTTEITISEKALISSSAKWIDINSIIVAMYGATAGRIAINKIPLTTNQACCNITINSHQADYNFVYFYLKSKFDEILNMATGAAQQNLNAGMLKDFEISIPDLPTQQRIASILSSLDDKIELNRQMNQTLEDMAQTLFREMCVPKGKELPEGWRKGKLGEIVDVKGGTTPKTTIKEYWNGEYYWSTPKDLSNIQSPILIDTERKITKAGVEQISSGILPIGTLLLSSRAPIGYLAITQIPVSINQGYIAIQGRSISNIFMLFWLKSNIDIVKSRANGSTFQEISKSNFREIEIVIPSNDILSNFNTLVDSIFDKIVKNVYQNQTLTQLRDSLLPKLMSGEVEV
jgi:type I restriction enzyme S subunit